KGVRMDRKLVILAATLFTAIAGCHSDGSDHHALEAAAQERIALGKSTDAALKTAASCPVLEQELKALAAAEIETFFEMSGDAGAEPVDMPAGAPLEEGDASSDGGDASRDFTNNQVAGVDEADFIKTDGRRLFVLGNGALHRFDIPAPGEVVAAGSIDIEGSPAAMLLAGDRVLVISGLWSPGAGIDLPAADMPFLLNDRMKTTLVEWPDGAPGAVLQERYFDGSYLTARETDGAARVLLHGRLPNAVRDNLWQYWNEHADAAVAKAAALADLAALPLDALLPRSYIPQGGELEPLPYTGNDCASFEIPEDSNGSGVTSIVSLDMDDPQHFITRHIVSNRPTVYVSADHLFLAESAQDWWWYSWNDDAGERLNLHAFDLAGGGMEYLGSGRVEGTPVNQFSLDEHDGVLRIATWIGGNRWWWTDTAIETRLYTLEIGSNALTPLGELAGIAPGEQLFAARFAGDIAYLVTFEQIDPLFTIDLSDPAKPSIVGELEVPGFSTYLHPLENGRLLAVGVGGDETGATWNTVVSLFDVSDLAAPALLARHDLSRDNSGWSWSEALYEHKAFQFHAGSGLLALPLGAYRVSNDIWEWSSTLEMIKVENDQLSAQGSIDHTAYFDSSDSGYSPDIRRSFFIDDFIYAISGKAVSVHAMDNPAVTVADALITNDN
ncbi:MAG TPA: beta-propeller domain-containing protein, partial [Gammaproteobacteria bacterium]